jgi:hypothetical protein
MSKRPLVLLLFLSAVCAAEPHKSKVSCKASFAVAHRRHDSPTPVVALSKQQSDWWEQTGVKKFPDLCLVFEEDADYLLVWENRITRKAGETHHDPLQDDALKDRKGPATADDTSPEDPPHETVMQEVGSIEIYKRATGEDGKPMWRSIGHRDSVRNATGWFTSDTVIDGSPTRKAMESALKFIKKHP